MPAPHKKSQRKWLYLAEEDVARLGRLVENFPSLNEAMVLGTLAAAALRACEAVRYQALPSVLIIDQVQQKKNGR